MAFWEKCRGRESTTDEPPQKNKKRRDDSFKNSQRSKKGKAKTTSQYIHKERGGETRIRGGKSGRNHPLSHGGEPNCFGGGHADH